MGLNICSLVQNGIWYFYVYFIYRAVIGLDMDWFRMVYDTSMYTLSMLPKKNERNRGHVI